MTMLELEKDVLNMLLGILRQNLPIGTRILFYGSRVNGNAKPHSDIDLAFISSSKISLAQMGKLRVDIEESDIPYRVDVSDWNDFSDEFQKIILEKSDELSL